MLAKRSLYESEREAAEPIKHREQDRLVCPEGGIITPKDAVYIATATQRIAASCGFHVRHEVGVTNHIRSHKHRRWCKWLQLWTAGGQELGSQELEFCYTNDGSVCDIEPH